MSRRRLASCQETSVLTASSQWCNRADSRGSQCYHSPVPRRHDFAGSLALTLLLLAALLAPSLAHAQTPRILTGQVVKVVDGDTIHVRIADRVERVRYIGMNAPELGQPGGREATEANRKLVEGQLVNLELDVQERDRYGRLLAYVYVAGDVMVNAELVGNGYAQVMTVPPNVKYQDMLLKRQREARLLQLGLWKGAAPPAPPASQQGQPPAGRPGVAPVDAWTCPPAQPIKGNFTTYSGERCIYHVPGGQFYTRTKPERCYASGEEAVRDGCRASKR
jgi:micrococcal nuclease